MARTKPSPYPQVLNEDYEFQEYIRSLTTCSNRVRYLLIAIAVTSLLLFFGKKNTHYSWPLARLDEIHLALELQKHLDQQSCDGLLAGGSLPETLLENWPGMDAERLRNAAKYACMERKRDLEHYLRKYREIDIDYYTRISVPFLGLSFDSNDLGVVGGLAFTFLFLLLLLGLAREHENLFLCLWKIDQVAQQERRWNDGESKANFLYHALVMTQGLSQPPTLARVRGTRWAFLVRSLLFVPLALEAWILCGDWRSREVAVTLSATGTWTTIAVEILACVLIFVLTVGCLVYARAEAKRWQSTFYKINPRFENKDRIPWLEWMLLRSTDQCKYAVETPEATGELRLLTFDSLSLPARSWSAGKRHGGWVSFEAQDEEAAIELRSRSGTMVFEVERDSDLHVCRDVVLLPPDAREVKSQ